MREYVREDGCIVEMPDHEPVKAEDPDALRFLHGLYYGLIIGAIGTLLCVAILQMCHDRW